MRLLLFICAVWSMSSVKSQVNITITIPTYKNDMFSKKAYSEISKENRNIATKTATSVWYSGMLQRAVDYEYLKLKSITPSLVGNGNSVKFFIQKTSYSYIEKKYPISNPVNATLFKNIAIRNRFRKKFLKEKLLIDNYLSGDIYLSEGERIFLFMASLENVINITLENESY